MLCMCICNDVWMMFTNAMKDMSVFETVCVVCMLCVSCGGHVWNDTGCVCMCGTVCGLC